MSEKKSRVGRPRKTEKVENYPVMAYMPNLEAFEMVRKAAEQQNLSISAWARSVLIREAQQELGKATKD